MNRYMYHNSLILVDTKGTNGMGGVCAVNCSRTFPVITGPNRSLYVVMGNVAEPDLDVAVQYVLNQCAAMKLRLRQ
jgi:hypothetical protein